MRTIGAISHKGGVWKTSLMTGLAAVAARNGCRTWIIDMDRQASAYRWGEERAKNPELPLVRVEMAHTARTFELALKEARDDHAAWVMIDTPQGTDDDHFHAIAGAHLVLIPTKPFFFDLNGIVRTLDRVKKEQRSAYVVLTDVEAGGAEDVAKARDALKGTGARFADLALHHAVDVPHATELGMGVSEFASPNARAVREIKSLADWAFKEANAAAAAVRAAQESPLEARLRQLRADAPTRTRKRTP